MSFLIQNIHTPTRKKQIAISLFRTEKLIELHFNFFLV